jgi:hypothetical protein
VSARASSALVLAPEGFPRATRERGPVARRGVRGRVGRPPPLVPTLRAGVRYKLRGGGRVSARVGGDDVSPFRQGADLVGREGEPAVGGQVPSS